MRVSLSPTVWRAGLGFAALGVAFLGALLVLAELPVGVVTSLIGAIVFLILFSRSRRAR